MFDSIYKDLSYRIRTGGFWLRVIVLCVIVFIAINLLKSYFSFSNAGFPGEIYYDIINSICLSSDLWHNIKFPWVWITHVFVHEGFFHLLWNMLWLYSLSSIVEDLIGRKRAIIIFFEAAIFGGLFFLLSTQILPWYQGIEVHAQGSSAAVIGLLFAAATISPDYGIRLLFLGNIPIKYLALAVLILDLLFAGQNNNSGGHFAHIGGAFWGWAYISLLRKGVAMDAWLDYFSKNDNQRQLKRPSVQKRTQFKPPVSKEEKMNAILDKIRLLGIEKLSKEEKDFLDQFGKD